jgi:hypothetical protein
MCSISIPTGDLSRLHRRLIVSMSTRRLSRSKGCRPFRRAVPHTTEQHRVKARRRSLQGFGQSLILFQFAGRRHVSFLPNKRSMSTS